MEFLAVAPAVPHQRRLGELLYLGSRGPQGRLLIAVKTEVRVGGADMRPEIFETKILVWEDMDICECMRFNALEDVGGWM